MKFSAPGIDEVRDQRARLGDTIIRTPLVRCAGIEDELNNDTCVFGKLEFLQHTGTFKARGALTVIGSLDREQLDAGITAVSAGNHAVAVAFAAQTAGTHAKVVMTKTANPCRVEACLSYGAEIVKADDVHVAFEIAERIQKEEGRFLVHPFSGRQIATGTGTVGLEICEQCDDFDALIVPIGGGGLMGGVANAVKQLRPDCEIIGVEPEGAKSMHMSFDTGKAEAIDKVRTIADSLGAPYATDYSYEICRRNVDQLVLVDDMQLRRAMGFLFRRMKIAVEPAGAAATASLLGPLREQLSGKTVVLVFCGSIIDWPTWHAQAMFD